MTKRAGLICVLVGIILILSSLGMYAYFEAEDKRAEVNSSAVIPQIISAAQTNEDNDYESTVDYDTVVTKTIDGNDYVGYLSIPSQELELPIMADCGYDKLGISPCLYSGWARTENMVIAGHNYKCHFGRLSQLKRGDEITFTDMCNNVYDYQVADIEILPPSATREMTESDWELTLYTCTYTAKDRITIRCKSVK